MKMYNASKFIFFVALLLFSSCGGGDKANVTDTTSQKTKVRVEEVRLVPVDQQATFTATVEAETTNNITPAMGGRIRSISVDVGAHVRRGQAVVAMDATNYSQQEIQLTTLKRDYERYKELYDVGGISKQQLDQAKAQLDVAQSAFKNLGENTTLISPINGVVTARNYDPGDIVSGLPVLTIENINPVKVKINVSESYYSQVTKGMSADVQIDALRGETFEGNISLIYPTLDPASRTFPVEVQVNNNDQRIRPGMFARVQLHFGTNERPLISDKAVLKQVGSNDRYVFVEKGGKAVYTLVELGVRLNDKFEIISGLESGDRVVIEGNTGLIDGREIEVVQ